MFGNDSISMRKASLQDIPQLVTIEKEVFETIDQFSIPQFKHLITKSKGAFYVLLDGEKIIAYLCLLKHQRFNHIRIYSIAIHSLYQHQGIGKKLMQQAIDYSLDNKLNKIVLEVRPSNISAIQFYYKHHFKISQCLENYYGDENGFKMERQL